MYLIFVAIVLRENNNINNSWIFVDIYIYILNDINGKTSICSTRRE